MVSNIAMRIIKRAVEIRVAEGEKLETVVTSYTKLSKEQAQEIISELGGTK